jgi:hypothetical protein
MPSSSKILCFLEFGLSKIKKLITSALGYDAILAIINKSNETFQDIYYII